MGFQKILDKYRKTAFSERDKGARFERLMQAYLHIREHDVVVAKAGLPGIPSGTAGTVLHVFGGGEAYEVEFMLSGSSRVETASGDQIEKR